MRWVTRTTHLQRETRGGGGKGAQPLEAAPRWPGGGLQSNFAGGDKGPDPGPRGISGFCFHSVRSNPYLGVVPAQSPGQPPCVVENPGGSLPQPVMDTTPGHSLFWKFLEKCTENRQKDLQCVSCGVLFTFTLLGKTHLSQKAISEVQFLPN